MQKDVLKKRKKPVIVKAFQTPSFDPKGHHFYVFCKYQLLKYKPWRTRISDIWGGLNEDDTDMFCQKWNEFFQTDLGQSVVLIGEENSIMLNYILKGQKLMNLKRMLKGNVKNGCT